MHTFRKFKQFPKDDKRRTKSFSTAVLLLGDDSFFLHFLLEYFGKSAFLLIKRELLSAHCSVLCECCS